MIGWMLAIDIILYLVPIVPNSLCKGRLDVKFVIISKYRIRVNFGGSFIWRLYRERLLADIIIGGGALSCAHCIQLASQGVSLD